MDSMPPGTKDSARAQAQRARILDAARKCFSERGFHGASIAAIADSAGMSQGLIYRYFTNKAAIIRAITDEQSEGRRAALEDIKTCSNLIDRVFEKLDSWRGDVAVCAGEFDPALFLEVSAEATRDAEIAAVVTAQEQVVWVDFEDFVERAARARGEILDAATVRRRTIVLRCLIDGLILCYVRDPEMDRETLRTSLHEALAALSL